MPDEVVIDDSNYQDHIEPIINGERKSHGLISRDWNKCPHGSLMHARGFDLPLIPESEWQSRLDTLIASKGQLSDIRNQGMNGQPIPSRDQDGKGYCHTEKTEVLTEKGWTRWPDYNWSDKLGTVNLITGLMEFQSPLEKHIYEYKGEIIHSTNRRINFGVTPDHEMVVRKWDERRRTLSSDYTFQRAGDLGWYLGLMHAPEGFLGIEIKKLAIDGDREYNGDDFISLIAIITSCGWAGGTENTKNKVSFACFRENLRPTICALAKRNGFYETSSRPGVWVRENAKTLANWIRQNCYTKTGLGAENKRLADIIKCVNKRQINLFLKFFHDRNHTDGAAEVYYSHSSRLIDDIQELLLRIGKRGSILSRGPRESVYDGKVIYSGIEYSLYVSKTDQLCIDKKKHIERDNYNGVVYCAAVPNHTLITRYDGSILISSNCWAHSSTSAALIARAVNGEPYEDLSAFAVACIIKNYRDQGGNGADSVDFISKRGIPTSKYWPQQSMSRSNDNPTTWQNAALHKFIRWVDLDPNDMKRQLVTCLLLRMPVVTDLDWWEHSIVTLDLVSLNPFSTRIWNSWGDSWSDNGMGLLTGRKAIPDNALAIEIMTPSEN